MKNHFRTPGMLACLAGLSIFLAACGGSPLVAIPEGAERDAVLAYSEPAADTLFQGINANDYALFSQDFNQTIAASMDEASFAQMQDSTIAKLGQYISREVSAVEQDDQYVAVIYTATFELDDPVTVRLVFDKNEAHTVAGLWFDSARLREK